VDLEEDLREKKRRRLEYLGKVKNLANITLGVKGPGWNN
jgi:hypothetical protein